MARQQKGIENLTSRLDEQSAQIQKMSAELELGQSSTRTVLNKQ
jgi:hypothetical protein